MIGINLGFHESSACYLKIKNQEIVDIVIAEEERHNKRRYSGRYPLLAVKALLKNYPAVNRLISSNFAFNSFGKSVTEWEKSYSEHNDYVKYLKLIEAQNFSSLLNPNYFYESHHKCHAYSAMAQCPYEKSIIVVIDGAGSKMNLCNISDSVEHEYVKHSDEDFSESMSVFLQDRQQLELVFKQWKSLEYMSNGIIALSETLGTLFEGVSYSMYKTVRAAGKIMGLSAYGNPQNVGAIFPYVKGLMLKALDRENYSKKDIDSFSDEIFLEHANIAATMQDYFEQKMMSLFKKIKRNHPEYENLILVGGCALNCVFNAKLANAGLFKSIFVPPYPNDEGISLGVAYANALNSGALKFKVTPFSKINPFLGVDYRNKQNVEKEFSDFKVSRPKDLADIVAKRLELGEVVAVFRGRSECGPRALGHRSILAHPSKDGMKHYLNNKVKHRENFRPYGLMILQNEINKYFHLNMNIEATYMSFAPKVKSEMKKKIKESVHVDDTCRIQSISKENNPFMFEVISNFRSNTGIAGIINTSLNIKGEPIIETYADLKNVLERSEIKTVVVEEYLIEKNP
jgi:carbamoyltransferase